MTETPSAQGAARRQPFDRVTAGAVAIVAVLAVWLGAGLPGGGGRQIVSNVSQLTASTIAGIACLMASRRSHRRQLRRGWLLIGASCLVWAAGQLVWTWNESIRQVPPFPSPGDVGFVLATVAALVGLLSCAKRPDERRWHLRALLDGLIAAGSLFTISWMLLIEPLADQEPLDDVATALAFAYPVGDVALLTILVLLVARGSVLRRKATILLGCGFGLLAVADSTFAYTELYGLAVGDVSNVSWVAGYLLIALAARDALTHTDEGTIREQEPGIVAVLAPFAPVTLALITAALTGVARDDADPVLFLLALALFAALLLRQVVALLDNRALTTSLRRALAEASHAALHDPLTGLPNRALLSELLEHEIDRCRRTGEQFAVAFVDLDDFKVVNDLHGHRIGDEVLHGVAGRLRGAVRQADTVARFAGDEFVAVLSPIASEREAEEVTHRMVAALGPPIDAEGTGITIGASIGLVIGGGTSAVDDLLIDADRRMYAEKARHRAASRTEEPLTPSEL